MSYYTLPVFIDVLGKQHRAKYYFAITQSCAAVLRKKTKLSSRIVANEVSNIWKFTVNVSYTWYNQLTTPIYLVPRIF